MRAKGDHGGIPEPARAEGRHADGDDPPATRPPGDTPSGDTPSGDTLAADGPSAGTSAENGPSADRPASDLPSTTAADRSAAARPAGDRPSGDRLTAGVRLVAERLATALQRWARRSPSDREETSGPKGPSERPDPSVARTPDEFAEQLRRLKRYRGASYREMARLSGGSPVVSTLSQADKGGKLPSERVLRAYLHGCRLDEDAMIPWLEARGRLAMDDD